MSELLVTQCPHCQTRFRLTPAQLSVAAGHVRCGACLEVFHAADAAAAMTQAAPEEAVPSPVQTPPATDSLLHDDLDEPDLAALGLDESIIHEVNPAPPPPPPAAELHEDFLSTPPARDFGPDFDHQRTGLDDLLPERNSYAEQGIFQRDQPGPMVAQPARQAEPVTDTDTFQQPEQPVTPATTLAPDAAEDDLDAGNQAVVDRHGERLEPAFTPLRLEMLEEELLQEGPARRRTLSWLWTPLALLALLALPAQYLFYNFDALARDQHSRPVLENICLLVRCELPARVDISRIRSTNLLVRPHPEFPNALAIDVILYNRADFAQPFPVLEMQFADAAGRQLASRRFRPEEYLSGELAGVSLMPSQTPIHVGLNMLDPGEQARSYRLEFHSP